jgi:uncharacterized membrane protein HdeD (DUF308 family)
MIINRNRRRARISWVILLIGIFLIFGPLNMGMDGFNGGFALAAFGVFMVIMGVVSVIIFGKVARAQDRLMADTASQLAHWSYPKEQWETYAEYDHREDKKTKKMIFYIITGFAVLFGILFSAMDPEVAPVILSVMAGLVILMGFVAYLSVTLSHSYNQKHPGEAIISLNSAYLNGQFHAWNMLLSRLDKASLAKEEGMEILSLSYSAPARGGANHYEVRIPVPLGKEKEAEMVLHALKTHNRVK